MTMAAAVRRPPGLFQDYMWERDPMPGAVVYDLEARDSIGRVEVHASGRPWFAILGIFPLGAPSSTETWACQKLGTSMASVFPRVSFPSAP